MPTDNEVLAKQLELMLDTCVDHYRSFSILIRTLREVLGDEFIETWKRTVAAHEAINFKGCDPAWTAEARQAFDEFAKS